MQKALPLAKPFLFQDILKDYFLTKKLLKSETLA